MKNKILIELLIPQIDEKYNIYIPLNKNIANIIQLFSKSIKELTNIKELDLINCQLYNGETALAYSPELLIRETNIRNGTKLILM